MTGTRRRLSRASLALCAALIAGGALPRLVPITAAQAQAYEDEGPFAGLEQYGDWVDHWRYGRVWVPREVDADWRPYTAGHWVLTDDYGWYWDSDEPWGWATYHYGRWALDDDYGWIWIPGDQWGPAWVDWRQDDDTVGWAPLPPEVGWSGDSLAFGDVDLESDHYRPTWIFVPALHFLDRDFRGHVLPPSRNFSFLRHTERATHYESRGQGVFNRSIDPGRIAALTHQDVRPVGVTTAGRPPAAGQLGAHTDRAIGVFRPDFKARPLAPAAHPANGAGAPPAQGQARSYPSLPQGGLHAPGNPAPASGAAAPARQPDQGQFRALQERQADEARKLQEMQAHERAGAQAARDAEIARRHQQEQQDLQRIQQQQRTVQQNRQQLQQIQPQRAPAPVPQPQHAPPPPHPVPPGQPGGPPR